MARNLPPPPSFFSRWPAPRSLGTRRVPHSAQRPSAAHVCLLESSLCVSAPSTIHTSHQPFVPQPHSLECLSKPKQAVHSFAFFLSFPSSLLFFGSLFFYRPVFAVLDVSLHGCGALDNTRQYCSNSVQYVNQTVPLRLRLRLRLRLHPPSTLNSSSQAVTAILLGPSRSRRLGHLCCVAFACAYTCAWRRGPDLPIFSHYNTTNPPLSFYGYPSNKLFLLQRHIDGRILASNTLPRIHSYSEI